MKTIHLRCAAARHATLVLILFLTAQGLWAQPATPTPPGQVRPLRARAATNNPAGAFSALPTTTGSNAPAAGGSAARSGFRMTPLGSEFSLLDTNNPDGTNAESGGYEFEYDGVDVNQVLDVYEELVGRTLIRGTVANASIILKTHSPLTKTEAVEVLQAVLALNNITFVNIGEKFVKVVTPDQAKGAGGEVDTNDLANVQDFGKYVTRVVQLEHIKPSAVVPLIQSFGKLNDLFPIDDNGILVMRDYSENVKRMMEMIKRIDVSVPAVYISEVIPIRYAKVIDIANALNSLGGSGGATISIGSSAANQPISGIGNRTTGTTTLGGMGVTSPGVNGVNGVNGIGGTGSTSPLGATRPVTTATSNPNGTASGSTSSLQSRLLNIVRNASGGSGGQQDPIQLFGQTKIIPNESTSSLLVYATRPDMDAITNIIAKLDVPLAQVLIEAVIVNYTLGNSFNFGVSAAQNVKTIPGSDPLTRVAGGLNNGQTFLNFANSMLSATNASNGVFGNNLGSGLSYFGSIGPTWDVALSAAQADSHASIIQRPRIQTSQAIPAQFFVGSSVPYITGNYSYYGGGPQNSYSQLSVGVELDVTPFINPEGAVTMQIMQQIDAIDNPNYNNTQQPSTVKRTLNTTITVRDRDTVMLGGFIEADKSHSQSGVPFLSDIPLLGNLFKKRDDQKTRKELVVLMRPTVLGTPELAARNTIAEGQRLPGISATLAEDVQEQNKLTEAEKKKELKNPKTMSGGSFNTTMPTNAPSSQLPQPQAQGDGSFTPVPPQSDLPAIPADTTNAAPVIP